VAVLGVGVDIVRVRRLTAAAAARPRILTRVFTPNEVAEAGVGPERWRRLASRFAAKEAVVKACGGLHGSCWQDIAVRRVPREAPKVDLAGPLARWLAEQHARVWISLSHEQEYAVAVAVLTAEEE